MSRHRGFTVIELIVVIVIVAVAATVLTPKMCILREMPSRTICAANISSVTRAMLIYATDNDHQFPIVGARDPSKPAVGFTGPRVLDGAKADFGGMTNNVTASLWMLGRSGDVLPASFICKASGDHKDMLLDRDGGQLQLRQTWDFGSVENLSYSPVNMYHEAAKAKWGDQVTSADAILGDNNNADGQAVHTLRLKDRPRISDVQKLENSQNHFGDGQNFGFGDGHVMFCNGPFVEPKDDNVYAMTIEGKIMPPTLSNTLGAGDAVLLPITGNNGVSLSGLPGPGHRVPPATYDWVWPIAGVIGVIGLAVVICLIADGVGRLVRGGKARANER